MELAKSTPAPKEKFVKRNPNPVGHNSLKKYKNPFQELSEEHSHSKITEKEYYSRLRENLEAECLSQKTPAPILLAFLLSSILEHNKSVFQIQKLINYSKLKDQLLIGTAEQAKILIPIFSRLLNERKNALGDLLKIICLIQYHNTEVYENELLGFAENLLSLLEAEPFSSHFTIKMTLTAILSIAPRIPMEKNQKFFSRFLAFTSFAISEEAKQNQVENQNFLKLFAALLRAINYLFIESRGKMEQNIFDQIFNIAYKYMFIGTTFHNIFFSKDAKANVQYPPKSLMPSGKRSIYGSVSSSSDLTNNSDSDNKVASDPGKLEEFYCKIRNLSCLCIQAIVRLSPKVVDQHWMKLLRTPHYHKDFLKFLQVHEYKHAVFCSGNVEELKLLYAKKQSFQNGFQNEPSLLYLLIFEQSSKVKINVCNTLTILIDNLAMKKLLDPLDTEKIEKSKKESGFQPLSHMMYNALKNLHFALLFTTYFEDDLQVLNQVLRLYSVLMMNGCFEKIPSDKVLLLFEKSLIILLQGTLKHILSLKADIKIEFYQLTSNTIVCINCLVSLNLKLSDFMQKYLVTPGENNLPRIFLNYFESSPGCLDPKELEAEERVTLLCEIISFFGKIQKNYSQVFYPYVNKFFQILKNLLPTTRASAESERSLQFFLTFLKVFEEITKYSSSNRMSVIEGAKEDGDSLLIKDVSGLSLSKEEELFEDAVYGFLSEILLKNIEHPNSDVKQLIVSILSNFSNEVWRKYFRDQKELMIEGLQNVMMKSDNLNLKASLYRIFGILIFYDEFKKDSSFQSIFLRIIIEQIPNEVQVNNLTIKKSWALANWCCNYTDFSNLSIETLVKIYGKVTSYCITNKEKLLSNGLRALGYFIKICSDEQTETFGKEGDFDKSLNEIRKIFIKTLKHKSSKVSWNASVALGNVLRSKSKKIREQVVNHEMFESMLQLLRSKGNFKAQIHCLLTLEILESKEIWEKGYSDCVNACLDLLSTLESQECSFGEFKNYESLRKILCSFVFTRVLKDFEHRDVELQVLLAENSQKILDMICFFMNALGRDLNTTEENLEYDEHKETEKIKKNQHALLGKDGTLVDELIVKGEESFKIVKLNLQVKGKDTLASSVAKLELVRSFCKRLHNLVEKMDEASVSFTFFEILKEYSDFEIKTESPMTIKLFTV